MRLQVIQAEEGDCFILECGTRSDARYVLVDGGPATVYERHLRGQLEKIRERGGRLDLAILSHVDNDHVIGFLDLMTELREQRASHAAETVEINALWHNAFSQTIGSDSDLEARINTVFASAGNASAVMTMTNTAALGIGEGDQLRSAAEALGIPINAGFPNHLVSTGERPHRPVEVGDLRLHVVGPTRKNLRELKKQWLEWLDKYEAGRLATDPSVAAMADRSIPNLSSIMVVAESNGKTVLLAGDGRGDDLIEGLSQANLLGSDGTLHVDVLKAPHHGSARNVTSKFFKTVTADKYIISANGKYGNPDLDTLIWIVRASKAQGRTIEILATNETPSTRELTKEYDPKDYGYRLSVMNKGSDSMTMQID